MTPAPSPPAFELPTPTPTPLADFAQSGSSFQMWQTIGGAVAFVLILVGAALALRWLNKRGLTSGANRMRVIERAAIGRDSYLCLVQIDGRTLLVASGRDGATLLCETDNLEAPAPVSSALGGAAGKLLDRITPPRKPEPEPEPPPAPVREPEGNAAGFAARFQQSVDRQSAPKPGANYDNIIESMSKLGDREEEVRPVSATPLKAAAAAYARKPAVSADPDAAGVLEALDERRRDAEMREIPLMKVPKHVPSDEVIPPAPPPAAGQDPGRRGQRADAARKLQERNELDEVLRKSGERSRRYSSGNKNE